MKKTILGFVCALSIVSVRAVLADTGIQPWPRNEQQLRERLKAFDPAAVAAAQHYYNSPMINSGMLSMISSLTPTILANMARHETKPMSDEDRAKAVAVLDQAMKQNFDYLIGLNTVLALQTFSKDELVAMDKFYSSSTGQGILSKMPQLSKSMPSVLESFMPKYLASVKDDMKKEGIASP